MIGDVRLLMGFDHDPYTSGASSSVTGWPRPSISACASRRRWRRKVGVLGATDWSQIRCQNARDIHPSGTVSRNERHQAPLGHSPVSVLCDQAMAASNASALWSKDGP